jgi:serine/threonine protein kinase
LKKARHSISPLFGQVALHLGLVTSDQLLEALYEQEEQRTLGQNPMRLGQILVAKRHLEREDVNRIMREVEERTKTLVLPGFPSLELVSRNAHAMLFRGQAVGERRMVLIKILRFELAEIREDVERFVNESRSLDRLDHPNVVKVLHVDDLEGIPYLVLEHIMGPDLGMLLEEEGPLDHAKARKIAGEVVAGLAHAHSVGIFHGAIRPSAILIPRVGGAKLTDFAICDWGVARDTRSQELTAPFYLPPEMLRPAARPSVKADIYSLGVVLYEMLTGRPPFKGDYREVVRQHLRRPVPDPRVLCPSMNPRMGRLCMRMLAKSPDDRPASVTEVGEEIAALATEERHAGTSRSTTTPSNLGNAEASAAGRLQSRRSSRTE